MNPYLYETVFGKRPEEKLEEKLKEELLNLIFAVLNDDLKKAKDHAKTFLEATKNLEGVTSFSIFFRKNAREGRKW